ncbi:hypothetical protein EGJ44_15625 [Ectopseudomonas oleovorans]|uniref:Uncharacterized protein n=1 Tax=Ectopseudomonas oleovorans TaxID=301 RepID=A0A427HEW8_ECTOL|nr:hypothetical protein EGJ44_15625 [Pseudomonas oleovorans]
MGTTRVRGTSRQLEQRTEGGQSTKRSRGLPALRAKSRVRVCWGRLREGAESYAKALASDILR